MPLPLLPDVRARLGEMVFAKVAGEDGPAKRDHIHDSPGERWFAEDAAIREVHGDSSMFVGGMRALLLQSLHPLAMAGVAQHSGYRGDPWGRLQRTSYFLAVTTFGPAEDAERTCARIRGIHRRVTGEYDGVPYAASDPHLLRWVHVAEVDSFLRAHELYGAHRLSPTRKDEYVADTALVARKLGVVDPPESTSELAAQLASYRPELRSTPEARATARFLLLDPPLPLVARPPYAVLSAAAVATLPWWTRWPLRLPYLPLTERTTARVAGKAIVGGFRWIAGG
ncbi:hypothetical protein GCM10011519_20920 [Marmoricola endophyticus]|uniref:ER-bound oxygenase mpaB/mpaB'/Rubber oxygenase catalytic domain-containing protein n=1 Tax=Marmoricola endophyticus TaxID=2040280 RepID=A0A917F3K2_9ACTN|nr:oxygenase MpaB family protein [Marmoricola endophyticus]GGF46747.1 hypothetical protein GCM10011519_20920 [Marmoricola endophyticus]